MKFVHFASRNNHRDDIRMSLEWCNHIDGMTIFPKLPVHIRVYRKKWERNRSVAKCVREAKSGSDKLRELNDVIQPAELEQQAPFPAGIKQPTLQARNNNSHSFVGGTLVGQCPSGGLSHTKKTRGKDRSKPTGEKRKRKCLNCEIFGCQHLYDCSGRGGKKRCDYLDLKGVKRCYKCWKMREDKKSTHDPYACPAASGHRDDCPHFKIDSGLRIKLKD